MNKDELLKSLMSLDFMAVDLGLFLNTHPENEEAVAEYDRIIRAADEVRSQYESQFGPLCSFRSYAGGQWKWIDNPWPWTSCANPDMEKESCENMWIYEKKLEYPVKITKPDARMAKIIIEQYGGGDGELAASLRYLSQKFTMVTPQAQATLNDIATEELAHLEMVGAMVHQLTRGLTEEQIKAAGLDPYYVAHGLGIYPSAASGVPFNASYVQSKGDPITDLYEDMAAEQKARSTYEYLIDLCEDPDVLNPLRFLREREIVHFQRFGECLDKVSDYLSGNKVFVMKKPNNMR